MADGRCRFCAAVLRHSFCDLGLSPLSNAFVAAERLQAAETFYPLHALVCDRCWLVQLPEHESPERIFGSDYAYFSSYSDSWLSHCKSYVDQMVARFAYNGQSRVVEIASNDGYLLQYFRERGIPVLGIEPAENCALDAERKGIPTLVRFFGTNTATELAADGRAADLLLGNNVLAHVPDLNDFVRGLKILLKPGGVITLEFPHLLRLIRERQFDTIYHEHFSYFSFTTAESVLAAHDLTVFDVQELPTHGGSLRVFASHSGSNSHRVADAVAMLRRRELDAGLTTLAPYDAFAEGAQQAKFKLLEFLIAARREGKKVWGYGAPAKGNTLLNYCGIRSDLLAATVDRSPQKQGRFLPGTRIPIHEPERIREERPDYLLILPWNLQDEIMAQMSHIRSWGGRFVVPIPEVRVLP